MVSSRRAACATVHRASIPFGVAELLSKKDRGANGQRRGSRSTSRRAKRERRNEHKEKRRIQTTRCTRVAGRPQEMRACSAQPRKTAQRAQQQTPCPLRNMCGLVAARPSPQNRSSNTQIPATQTNQPTQRTAMAHAATHDAPDTRPGRRRKCARGHFTSLPSWRP